MPDTHRNESRLFTNYDITWSSDTLWPKVEYLAEGTLEN